MTRGRKSRCAGQLPGKKRTRATALAAAGSELLRIPPQEWVFDWNSTEGRDPLAAGQCVLTDESLRDGIQSPSAVDPTIEEKLQIVQLMEDVGIGAADLGLPGAGPRALADAVALARYIRDNRLALAPCCAARTVEADVAAVAEAVQQSGQPIEVATFIGSSPIRQYAENWTLDHLLETSTKAIDFAVKHGLVVGYVTEDTTRASPTTLDRLFRAAVDHGATRLTLCDTAGHATPQGTANLVRWTRDLVCGIGARVAIDWHGHNDRGLALVNSLTAFAAGADRVHGCAMGIGERAGNAAIDLLVLNLYLLGMYPHRVVKLVEYVRTVAEATHMPVPPNYPLSGEDAFRTATGVHAAAIIKAKALGDEWLADRVYSAVPATEFGRDQQIDIGPMSGLSNVRHWLRTRGYAEGEAVLKAILARAKRSNRTLTAQEVAAVIAREGGAKAAGKNRETLAGTRGRRAPDKVARRGRSRVILGPRAPDGRRGGSVRR